MIAMKIIRTGPAQSGFFKNFSVRNFLGKNGKIFFFGPEKIAGYIFFAIMQASHIFRGAVICCGWGGWT